MVNSYLRVDFARALHPLQVAFSYQPAMFNRGAGILIGFSRGHKGRHPRDALAAGKRSNGLESKAVAGRVCQAVPARSVVVHRDKRLLCEERSFYGGIHHLRGRHPGGPCAVRLGHQVEQACNKRITEKAQSPG